ncbi:PRD domain-containing protein [[Eubacterium] hominis]|uniref:PRD domain-containing protein n=1 Tax=[Eubacterium] hominis TaxID=2764325 RepID=UPI003A4D2275
MKIKKLLNNNVVIAKDRRKGEVVVMGTGIGFQAKPGDYVCKDKIQKVFILNDNTKLEELISQIPASYLELTEKIVAYAYAQYDIQLSESIYLSLTDHLYFAIKRIREQTDIDNPFLVEVKQFYREEYGIGLYAKKLIYQMYQVDIPEEEIGYIAMHVIENTHNKGKRYVGKTLEVVDATITFLRKNYLNVIDEDGLAYTRLLNHIKHFAKRYIEDKENDIDDQLLSKTITEVFQKEWECVESLSLHLKNEFGREIKSPEKNYLILHLRNCKDLKIDH